MEAYCPYCMTVARESEPCPGCGQTPLDYVPGFHHLLPGALLHDRYIIGGVLGEGGFGITYLAWDQEKEERVAVKEYFPVDKASRYALEGTEVRPHQGPNGEIFRQGLDRFIQEAQTLEQLRDLPQIIHVKQWFRANGTAYIIMEYVQGLTLTQWVQQSGGTLPADVLLEKMKGVFSSLQILHSRGLIHRDISPDNMMLQGDTVRLLDFGSAREVSGRTETLSVTLRHGYAPVEQYQPMGQGPWTDIYSLSATIYYCLTGITPPHALERLVADTLETPNSLGAQLPHRQEQVLLYGLGVRPRRRFQSMEAMARELYEKS